MRNENVVDDGRIEAEIDFVFDLQLRLQQLIDEHGITRTELARRAGITKARLSQLMRAEANPTARVIVGLFHALGEELAITLKSEKQVTEARGWRDHNHRRTSSAARQDEVLQALFQLRPPVVSPVMYPGNENSPDLGALEQAA